MSDPPLPPSADASVLLIPPFGLFWENLVEVLAGMPLPNFLRASPAPFMIEVPDGVLEPLPPFAAPRLGERLEALAESGDLDDARVFYLAAPRGEPVIIGRARKAFGAAGVVLDVPTVSKRHAQLSEQPQGWRLTDLEAGNGTFVEDERLRAGIPTPVHSGQVLQFSTQRYLFLLPRHIHAMALLHVEAVKRRAQQIPSSLRTPPEGVRLRDVVSEVAALRRAEFVSRCPAVFLLQVPLEAELPEGEDELPGGTQITKALSRSRIIAMQRSKKVSETRVFAIPADGTTAVGRGFECDVILDERSVSKRHAEIHPHRKGWRIVDLDSANGTFIEGQRLPGGVTTPLHPGQRLLFSSYRMVVLSPALLHHLAKTITERTGE